MRSEHANSTEFNFKIAITVTDSAVYMNEHGQQKTIKTTELVLKTNAIA